MIYLNRGFMVLWLTLFCFVLPVSAAEIELISRSDMGVIGNGPSTEPTVNADGQVVAYVSDADNLVDDDPGSWYWNTDPDVFVYDRSNGSLENASRGLNPNNYWFYQTVCKTPALNATGDLAAFACASGYHIKYRERFNVYLYDRLTGTLGLVTEGLSGRWPNATSDDVAMSADGSMLTFSSNASNLILRDPDQISDVYVYNIMDGSLDLASVNSLGEKGDGDSWGAVLSGNGQRVAYVSEATNLVAGDFNSAADIFYADLHGGSVRRIASPDRTDCAEPTLSGDGSLLAFSASDGLGVKSIYLVEGSSEPRLVAKGGSPSLSHDGRFLAYVADVPGAPSGVKGILRLDLGSGVHELISTANDGAFGEGDATSPAMSAYGSTLVFSSRSSNLVEGDDNACEDVFIVEASEDTTPPVLHVDLSSDVLWPPNKKYSEVYVNGFASDDSGYVEVEITLNDEYGSVIDQVVPGFGSSIWLEAWRDGDDEDGRLYTVKVVATDAAGNQSVQTSTVLVPHDVRK